MKDISANLGSKGFLASVLVLQFIVCALVFFDVPVARQVLGFVYFTVFPGFLVVKILKLSKVGKMEIILLSVGFSVAFLMFAGLLINQFCFLLGFPRPLSLFPLMVILNSILLAGTFLLYVKKEKGGLSVSKNLVLLPLVLLFLSLPVSTVVGAIWVSAFGNNSILLFMILATMLLFIIGIVSKQALTTELYSIAVLIIAVSLLFHSTLISKYLVTFGSDIAGEYFVFKTTQNDAYWSSIPLYPGAWYGRINSMLSVTILPTTYSTLLNMNATHVLKVVYPIILSFVPLTLYRLWQKGFGKKMAFAATFLLMAQNTFYFEMVGLARQMVGELFFVLLLFVILDKKIKHSNKMIGFVIFGVGLITSHYALAVIFLSFISIAYISLVLVKRPSRNLTLTMIVFFFVAMFTWYIYTSGSSAFDSILTYGNYVFNQLDQFFDPASRGGTILRGLGLEKPPTIWNMISRGFAYATELLIAFGFLGVITRQMNIKWEKEYFVFTIMAVGVLVALVALPGLAGTLNMTRFYHILLFFLAPLCILGAKFVIKLISKREKELGVSTLLLIVLVPYFLFQTNFVYEVVGSESWSIPLSGYRMNGYKLYSHSGYMDVWSVFGARWMRKNVDVQQSKVYADYSSIQVLITYGSIYGGYIVPLSNTTRISANGTIYLNRLNTVHKLVVAQYYVYPLDELTFLDDMNKIYTNGASEINLNP